jgi:ribose 5-phosphate isomerase B
MKIAARKIAIVADHNAVPLKARLAAWLADRGHEVDDRGVHDDTQVADYPYLCADVGAQVVGGQAELGVVLGGSGSGEQMACNKVRGVRAALCHCTFTAETWLATAFKGGRHQARVEQIMALERGEPLR